MPIVPTYDSPMVSAQSDPSTFEKPTDAGEQYERLGNALQIEGQRQNAQAVEQQHLANADAVLKTETSFKNDYLAFQQSLNDRKGQNAWGVTNDLNQWFEKNASNYTDSLTNDVQKRAFNATFQSVRSQGLESTGRYESEQHLLSVNESGKDSIQSSINMAAADHNNDSTVQGAKSDITKRVQLLGVLNGWSPEIRDAQMTSALTDLHKQVIGALVDENPDRAQAYYEANKNEIAGSERDAIDKTLRQGTLQLVSQQASDAIMSRNVSESEALAIARSRFTGKTQDDVVRRVTERYAEIDALRERDQKNAADSAYSAYTKGGSLAAVPASVLSRMDGQALIALQKEDSARASGKLVNTDSATYYGLQTMASRDPQRFQTMDLRTVYPDLSVEDRKHFEDLQDQVKKTGSNDVTSLNEQLAQTHDAFKWGASNADKKGAFDSAVTRELSVEQNAKGRKLSYDERQAVIDRMAIRANTWFGTHTFSEVAGTSKAPEFKPDIPDEDRSQIASELKRRGLATDDATITRIYKRVHGIQ